MKNGGYIKKLVSGLLALVITFSTLIGCSPSGSSAHEHTFASFWVTNDEYHWHPSTCGHDVKGDEGRHEFTSETNKMATQFILVQYVIIHILMGIMMIRILIL